MRHTSRIICVLAVAVALVTAAEAIGCPNCKDGVNTSDPAGLNLARGYFFSILIMLAMPLTLIGSFAAYVWREMRRQQRREAEAGMIQSEAGMIQREAGMIQREAAARVNS